MDRLLPVAAVLLVTSLTLAAPLKARGDEPSFQILAFGETSGAMVPMRCQGGPGDGPTYAHLLAQIAAVRAEAPTLTLLSGGLLGDDPFSRYLATRGTWAARRLDELLRPAGLDAAVPGPGEFSLPGGHSVPLLSRLSEGATPYGALNLDCPAAGAPLCSAMQGHGLQIRSIGGLRVAVISLIGPATVQFADPRNTDHAAVLDPARVASAAAARLRAAGEADLVVALVNLDREAESPTAAVAFARAVSGVDLVVAGLGRNLEGRAGLEVVRFDGGRRFLIGVAPGVDALTRIRVMTNRTADGTRITSVGLDRLATGAATPVADSSHLLTQTVSEFCAVSMQPLNAGRLAEPISAWELLWYVMEIARREVGADLTVFTSDTLWADPDEQLKGAITAEDLNRMFPLSELAVLEVKGAVLKGFLISLSHAGEGPSPKGIEVLGARVEGPPTAQKVTINGRLLDDGRWYRVVTSRYLALGGRGGLAAILTAARLIPLGETLFIRELVRSFLDRDRPLRLGGNRPIRPTGDFRDLWDLPRWDLSGAATLSFNQIHIDNSAKADYEDPQLNRAEFLGINGDLETRAILSNRIMLWNTLLHLQYGAASTGDGGLQETRDLVSMESAWSWTWLRNRYTRGQAWIPVPMLKGKLESEFTRGVDAPRHHLEGTVTIGPQWLFNDWASFFFGYGLRNELSDPDDPLHQGLEFGYGITRVPLLRSKTGTPILEFESRFELFWSDLGARDKLKGLGSAALTVALLDWLRFSVSMNAFVYREHGRDAAWALDNAAGLSLLGAFSVQKYW
ncbi:MAG: 5'-nucleotidase C-terminal domain-containing protein [Pseudomonadota bacterium]